MANDVDEKDKNSEEAKSKLTFDDDVIRKIVGITAQQIDGIISLNGSVLGELANSVTSGEDPKKGVSANVGEQQVSLKMSATIRYGTDARALFKEVVSKCTKALDQMTGLRLVQLEMNVDDVKTKEELEAEKAKDEK